MLDKLDAFSLKSSSQQARPSVERKKEASLAELLDTSFDHPNRSSTSPSRDRLQRMAGLKSRKESNQLNDSFNSKGSRSSLKKPPRPTQKSSKIADIGQPIKINTNKHPCFQNLKDQGFAYKREESPYKEDSSQKGPYYSSARSRDSGGSQSRKVQPQTKVLKDVMVLKNGKLVKQDVVLSLNQEGQIYSSDRSFQHQPSRKNYHHENSLRGSNSLLTSSMMGSQSPKDRRMEKTMNSIQRRNRSRERQNNTSYFDQSYDCYYEDDVRTTALQEFMVGGGSSRPSANYLALGAFHNSEKRQYPEESGLGNYEQRVEQPRGMVRGEVPVGRKMKLSELMK